MRTTSEKQQILVTWIGNTDCKKAEFDAPSPGENGPIRTLTDQIAFHEIYLLCSAEHASCAEQVQKWVKQGNKAVCKVVQTEVRDPGEYKEVYDAFKAALKTLATKRERCTFWYNLTPGTPAMQAVMLFLCPQDCPGEMVRVVEKRYAGADGLQIRHVKLPFMLPSSALAETSAPDSPELFIPKANSLVFNQTRYKVAPVHGVNVLILGESGAGKSVLAHYIHRWSGLKEGAFMEVNCAEIAGDHSLFRSQLFGYAKGAFTGATHTTAGLFEKADGGTLFLDEIGEIPLELQAVLLKVLQTGKVDPVGSTTPIPVNVRIIAATNKNLFEEVRMRRFRLDLYYRLAGYTPRLCALREIIQDAPEDFRKITEAVFASICKKHSMLNQNWTLTPQAFERLCTHLWPGNYRELEHLLLRVCLMADTSVLHVKDIDAQLAGQNPDLSEFEASNDLPTQAKAVGIRAVLEGQRDLTGWLDEQEQNLIEEAMIRSNNKLAAAARMLKIPYQRLNYKKKKI